MTFKYNISTFLAVFFLFVFLFAPILTFAQIPQSPLGPKLPQAGQEVGKAGFTLERLVSTITRVVNWFSWFIAVVAVAMGLYSAFLYITARGNANQVADAHKTLVYAIIGIAVAILAFSIVTITRTFLDLG